MVSKIMCCCFSKKDQVVQNKDFNYDEEEKPDDLKGSIDSIEDHIEKAMGKQMGVSPELRKINTFLKEDEPDKDGCKYIILSRLKGLEEEERAKEEENNSSVKYGSFSSFQNDGFYSAELRGYHSAALGKRKLGDNQTVSKIT